MKRHLLLLIACSALTHAAAQQLTGYVLDSQTDDSIALASVQYRGQGISAVSNLSGRFTIVRKEGHKLTFSAVGYQKKEITVDKRRHIVVRLKPEVRQLGGVTVSHKHGRYSRKNNPAVEMMKKVIAAKRLTDLKQRDFYQYDKYQKLVLAMNDITPAVLDSPKFKRRPWLIQQIESCPYNDKLILPLSVEETVSQKLYRRSPHDERVIIKGERSSGVNDIFETGDIVNVVLRDVFTDVNIYDDQIRLLQYPFTSPIGKDAIAFYRFYIEDTLRVEKPRTDGPGTVKRDSCYHLHFLPNNQQDVGFRGDLYVLADSSWQVKRCEMTLPRQTSVNFVKNMKITQEFTRLDDGTWVLSADDMFTELVLARFLQSFAVVRNTRLTGYTFDPLPRQVFKGKRLEVHDADSRMRNDEFWAHYRQVQLTKSESQMDRFVAGLQQIKGFKYFIVGLKALIENSIETGTKQHPSKFDIQPVNTIMTYNFIDHLRTRIGGTTTANLDSCFFANAYYAHGWGSHRNYYGAELTWSFNKKEYSTWEFPQRTLTLSSTYDVMSPSDRFLHTDKDNFLVAFKWTKADKMMFFNRQQLTFDYEQYWGLRTTLSLKAEEDEACGSLRFTPLSEPSYEGRSRLLRTTELRAAIRLAPGETYVNTKQRRTRINLDAPVFTLSHTWGIKNFLGGDYGYHYTEAGIYKRFWMKSWGKIDCYLKCGAQWSQVPFPLLCMPETNLSIVIQEHDRFQLINEMEFLNDRFASAMISWDLNGKLFNRIPLVKKLKCREYIGVKCLWGQLTDKNNPAAAHGSHPQAGTPLMHFPATSFVMDSKKPYVELTFGIHNIFKLVHVELVRRLTYTDLPTAHRWGVRYVMSLSF